MLFYVVAHLNYAVNSWPNSIFDANFCNCDGKISTTHMAPRTYNGMADLQVNVKDLMAGGPIILPHNHQIILDFIWDNNHLTPWKGSEYNLMYPDVRDPSGGEATYILRTFTGYKEKGTFIECRAFNGETGSKTLYMERKLGWKGLLIEPDPQKYEQLLSRGRNAWISNVCLGTKPYPYRAYIENGTILGDIHDYDTMFYEGEHVKVVQCMPIYSLIAAVNLYDVDYFALNWNGNELSVLRTIPFHKIKFQVISVPGRKDKDEENALIKFMDSQGYSPAPNKRYWRTAALPDLIFVEKIDPYFFYQFVDDRKQIHRNNRTV
ncbi:Protein Star [Orchesella cincta]|uniref:Protein Star n=1 Tax=Orchesella cincta TaxID=48709 RepID=A0A1D2NAI5_ORCCI|nr:Protein Star [Orchesella cincta]